ncbi:MAG: UDP-N-acetylglucosamine 1-carboxyvinyltransferase [Kiritimatiellia bacterium]|jgi:UDP-N-acetylglucosamine 1-carboxyvinyltransferase|nr:UDP-N-acetylglucosamine 1-carboxyvinyltransferase [Kiritimatiellia bacterium]MDD4442398.1 UDP-N-acetylglucosamine 1-carboxyvinyltransferase [Kiritimatiellia bacterium]OQC32303.1 MAG: UDP-N-acetylglucosamine 1-carboxyvinyltransferase 1 [Verrucomicrobia bacterium ADurb.Bin070]
MSRFVIKGGRPVSGVHRVPGNKNAALPMLAASLLTAEPVVLSNLPLIADVRTMIDLLAELGAQVELDGERRTVRICARRVKSTHLSKALCGKVRSSILFAGPLLARCGCAKLYPPGGDVIGRRRIDTHLDGFRRLGASVRTGGTYLFKAAKRLEAQRILLDEASVTATENLVMAAVLAKGTTLLYNAACEPHVQDLCRMINAMGGRIGGIGTNLLTIEGVESLHGTEQRVGPDYIDAGSYMAAALVTGGELTVEGVEPADFEALERPFKRLGVRWAFDREARSLRLPARQRLKTAYDLGDAIPKIEDGPWPMFPSDLMSVLIVLATQTRGTTLFFEKMFESRMYFVDHLIGMGARIVQCDPHRVVVTGPTQLHGTRVASPDIRAGMALLVAALCAKNETVILNAGSIDRGYESVELELRRLGAGIERVND